MASKNIQGRVAADLGVIQPAGGARTKQDWIGNQLKRVYDEALAEDIPNDMLDLLSALDEKTGGEGSDGEAS